MPLDTGRKKIAELRLILPSAGMFAVNHNLACPPSILEQISKAENRKKDNRNPSVPKRKDKNPYSKVLRECGKYELDHKDKHFCIPNMQYLWDASFFGGRDQTGTLMRIIHETDCFLYANYRVTSYCPEGKVENAYEK